MLSNLFGVWFTLLPPCVRQVHEIEPCYSREDFALPGHVGWVAEVRAIATRALVAHRHAMDEVRCVF